MELLVRPYVRQQDLSYFVDTEFKVAAEAGMISVGDDEEAARMAHRDELLSFVDSSPNTGIFVAESEGAQAGLVWVSERSKGEAWDLGPAIAWIYDIRVDGAVRRKGLGTRFLEHASDWALQAGYPAIGLHVYGSNAAARALYAANGFTAMNTYVQTVELASLFDYPAEQGKYVLHPASAAAAVDVDSCTWESFRRRALHTWCDLDEDTVRAGHERSVAATASVEHDDVTLLVRHENDDSIVGLAQAYASSGDLGTTRYAWMTDLITDSNVDVPRVCQMLLGGIARWATDRGLDTIRTSVHSSETAIYDTLAEEGFKDTNVFLRKLALGEDVLRHPS